MHPLIRILTLLAFAVLAPWLPPVALATAGGVLLVAGLLRPAIGRAMTRGLWRIRWLMLSIAVLCLWFTPGAALLPALGPVSPTDVGLALAAHRLGLLVVMAAAAVAAFVAVPAAEVAAALRRLLTVLPGRTGERWSDRIGLLLMELPAMERRVRDALVADQPFAGRAAALITALEAGAVEARGSSMAASFTPVRGWQWLLPMLVLALGGVALAIGRGH